MKQSVIAISALSLVAAGAPLSAQTPNPDRTSTNTLLRLSQQLGLDIRDARVDYRHDSRVDARTQRERECREDRREFVQRRLQLEQRMRQQHDNWHRAHSRNTGRDWTRQHSALHQRLERQYDNWVRAHRNDLNRCNEDWRADHDWDEERYDRDRWHRDDKLNRKLARLDRKRQQVLDKERRKSDRD